MTKYKEEGYVLQVGDIVEASIGKIYRRLDIVTKVTPTLAICDGRNVNQGIVRYPRNYEFGFYAKPYQRSNMTYRVLDNENQGKK